MSKLSGIDDFYIALLWLFPFIGTGFDVLYIFLEQLPFPIYTILFCYIGSVVSIIYLFIDYFLVCRPEGTPIKGKQLLISLVNFFLPILSIVGVIVGFCFWFMIAKLLGVN